MKRILVTGNSGSGKSTVSRALGDILDLPVIHLDLLFWNPGWVETPDDEFDAALADALQADAWICDGNYGRTMRARLDRADTILFLDLPRALCLRRVLTRSKEPRPDLPPGCPERKLDRGFVSFLTWVWNYPRTSRPQILALLDEYRERRTVIHLEDQAAIDRYVDGVRRNRSTPR